MAARPPEPAPWWGEGLRFRCTACGECCTGAPGHVWTTPEEIAAMARHLGLSARAFEDRYVRRLGRRLSLRERPNGDCVMLEAGRCRVYPVKPVPCSTFPFWEGSLSSPESWKETGLRCEGVDQGDLYDDAEIARLLAGDPRPLLVKHARPPEREVVRRGAATGGPGAPSPSGSTPASAPPAAAGPPGSGDEEARGARAPEPRWAAALSDLEALYVRLSAELPSWGFTCSASGACCDFDRYGHRLYASTLEAEWFFRRTATRANSDARACPAWGPDRLCRSREGRMLGCRVYFCPPYPRGAPEDLYARYHEEIRALHDRHGIPYAYRDIVEWGAERLPAPPPPPQ